MVDKPAFENIITLPMPERLDRYASFLSCARYRFASERELQDGLASRLTSRQYTFEREHRLAPKDIIDFLLPGGLGIEVKTKGSQVAVLQQLARYAEHEQIQGLLLVTARTQLCNMPDTIGGKPLHVASLIRSAF